MHRETPTRVWWDGDEVAFIRWTSSSLVFSWMEPTVTAMQMPRGAVVRLMEKGVLYIEGEMPDWVPAEHHNEREFSEPAGYEPHYEPAPEPVYAPLPEPEPDTNHYRDSHPIIPEPPISPHDTQPLEPAAPMHEKPKRPDLVNAIGRLIRKLSGGDNPREPSPVPDPVPAASATFRTAGVVGGDGDHRVERRVQPASR